MRSIFVFDDKDLNATTPGGVQLCSMDFLSIIRSSSDSISLLNVKVTRSLSWRLRRACGLGSYLLYDPSSVLSERSRLIRFEPTHVFINRVELIRFAPLFRLMLPNSKIIIMSHGNQSGDDLYETVKLLGSVRTRFSGFLSSCRLGMNIALESKIRRESIDGVCVMSYEEEVFERWYGTKVTCILPRLIGSATIDWAPVEMRAGFVGTLNHAPNLVALETIFDVLSLEASQDFEIRLVGSPQEIGRKLQSRYSFVNYLGKLDDSALQSEVRSWSVFLNPIFWLSRGASMKLSQALSWGIPVLSTRSGARGYDLEEDVIEQVDDNPEKFSSKLIELLHNRQRLIELRNKVISEKKSWPTVEEQALRVRKVFA